MSFSYIQTCQKKRNGSRYSGWMLISFGIHQVVLTLTIRVIMMLMVLSAYRNFQHNRIQQIDRDTFQGLSALRLL